MDYTTLIAGKDTDGSIKSWISYTLIPSTVILSEAETEIYRRLRTREMRATADVTLTSGNITAALPTRYLDPIRLIYRNTSIPIQLKPQDDLMELRTWSEDDSDYTSGMPSRFAVYDELLNFELRADATYALKMAFWQKPAALAADNLTNWLTDRYPRLLRVACLRSAAEFMENMEKFDRYEAQMSKILGEIDVMDDLAHIGTDPSLEYRDYA